MSTLSDAIQLGSTREITPEGYLLGKAALTTVGVQQYLKSDITGDPKDNELVGIFRPSETVFHKATIASARMKPITELHPSNFVDIENYKSLSLGHLGDDIKALDDKRLGASILITDKNLVAKITNPDPSQSLKEVSMGYTSNIIPKEGEYEGEPYSYAFDGPMEINHLAVVPQGRCGDTVSILDKKTEGVENMTVKNDADAATEALLSQIKQLEQQNKDLQSQLDDVNSQMEDMKDKASKAAQSEKDGASGKDKKTDAAIQAKIDDAVKAKIEILEKVKPYVKDTANKSVRELLVESCKNMVDEAEKKSDEYLKAVLDQASKNRDKAQQNLQDLAGANMDESQGAPKMYDAIEILKMEKK